jgi:hypothetical protein
MAQTAVPVISVIMSISRQMVHALSLLMLVSRRGAGTSSPNVAFINQQLAKGGTL